jgi:hypothetical protein
MVDVSGLTIAEQNLPVGRQVTERCNVPFDKLRINLQEKMNRITAVGYI